MSNSTRSAKAEGMFDLLMDYMERRLKQDEPLHPSELKEIRAFLAEQGINCIGEKNSKAKGLSEALPFNVTKMTGTKK